MAMGKLINKKSKLCQEEHMDNPEFLQEPVEKNDFLEEQVPKWYEQFKDVDVDAEPIAEDELLSLRVEAQSVLEGETKFFTSKQSKKKNPSSSWINTVLVKGTARDKLAARIITIQNSPIHNLSHLTNLVNSVRASKKRECIQIMDHLTDLFLEDLLIPGRKLRNFEKQPLSKLNDITSGCAKSRRLRLSVWMFEDKLKDIYIHFVSALDQVAKDTVDANRIKAVSLMNKLLCGHPEQEQVLLKNIINKIGDPNQKVVSKVIYCITQLLRIHPNMKKIVMNEIEKLLFRPNLNTRTQYYCLCCLSQFIFQNKDVEVAKSVISIYFSFFKSSIKRGEIDTRLMGALLMGVKRAYPFAKLEGGSLSEHIDTLYRLVHLTTFNVALHALCLLQQISSSSEDRFYSALYKKLLDPNLRTSCHHGLFINLLYKALLKDSNTERVIAIIKRLFQICLYMPVPLTCGLLFLISQLLRKRKTLISVSLKPLDDVQVFPSDSESDEEKYDDVDDEDETLNVIHENCYNKEIKQENSHGWLYHDVKKPKANLRLPNYDPTARNPAYANADKTAYLELVELSRHFHPTVALFAKKILNGELIIYDGDPLTDFTLNKFLERFVFKNPKRLEALHSGDIDKGPDPHLAPRKYYRPTGIKTISVTSSNYLSLDEKHIPVDELFLYKYMKDKQEERNARLQFIKSENEGDDNDDDDDNSSVASEEFEEMINKMVGKKKSDLDFMDDIGDKLNARQKKGGKGYLEEVSEGDETSSDEEEEEISEADDISDADNEVIDFGSEDDFEGEIDIDEAFSNKKMKSKESGDYPKKQNKKKKDDLQSLFAPAEEFAEILEDAGASTIKPGMVSSLQNKDNAAPKQLDWESKRDRWLKNKVNMKRKWNGKKNKFSKRQKK